MARAEDVSSRTSAEKPPPVKWDPATYLRFGELRVRPGIELMARIPDIDPRTVVDLGCGTGDLTAALARRWPDAVVVGVDSSTEMLEEATKHHPSVHFVHARIEDWEPEVPPDLVYSNAALHWLDDHSTLFTRLRSWLAPRGVMAIQMPSNWHAPTHTVPAEILDSGDWPLRARNALMRARVAEPPSYRRWLQPLACDMWETIYHQELTGPDPVLAWVQGSVLRPVVEALSPSQADRFVEECRLRYAEAYPPTDDGVTVLPFRRFFVVAVDDAGA